MAQFDVHQAPAGENLWLDCQADLLSHLNTRLVAPLLRQDDAPKAAGRLNPYFEIAGERYVMVTQYATAVELREFGPKVASLADHAWDITAALDVLITGV